MEQTQTCFEAFWCTISVCSWRYKNQILDKMHETDISIRRQALDKCDVTDRTFPCFADEAVWSKSLSCQCFCLLDCLICRLISALAHSVEQGAQSSVCTLQASWPFFGPRILTPKKLTMGAGFKTRIFLPQLVCCTDCEQFSRPENWQQIVDELLEILGASDSLLQEESSNKSKQRQGITRDHKAQTAMTRTITEVLLFVVVFSCGMYYLTKPHKSYLDLIKPDWCIDNCNGFGDTLWNAAPSTFWDDVPTVFADVSTRILCWDSSRQELVLKIAILAEKNAPNFGWYVDVWIPGKTHTWQIDDAVIEVVFKMLESAPDAANASGTCPVDVVTFNSTDIIQRIQLTICHNWHAQVADDVWYRVVQAKTHVLCWGNLWHTSCMIFLSSDLRFTFTPNISCILLVLFVSIPPAIELGLQFYFFALLWPLFQVVTGFEDGLAESVTTSMQPLRTWHESEVSELQMHFLTPMLPFLRFSECFKFKSCRLQEKHGLQRHAASKEKSSGCLTGSLSFLAFCCSSSSSEFHSFMFKNHLETSRFTTFTTFTNNTTRNTASNVCSAGRPIRIWRLKELLMTPCCAWGRAQNETKATKQQNESKGRPFLESGIIW